VIDSFAEWIDSEGSMVAIPFCGVSAYLWQRGVGPEELAREAIPLIQRAIDVGHPCAHLHLALASAYERIGETEIAITHYQEALALKPELNQQAWFHRVLRDAYLASGRAQKAAQEYESALALEPERGQRAGFHLRLARAYEESGRREEAIAEYERVLELEPDNAAAQRALDPLGR
jgi:superkiller protein 3